MVVAKDTRWTVGPPVARTNENRGLLAAWRIGPGRDERSQLVEKARLVGLAVAPDGGASREAEATPLWMHFVGVNADHAGRFQHTRRKREARRPIIDVCQLPPGQLLRRIAQISDFNGLIGLGSRDLAVEGDARYLDIGRARRGGGWRGGRDGGGSRGRRASGGGRRGRGGQGRGRRFGCACCGRRWRRWVCWGCGWRVGGQ